MPLPRQFDVIVLGAGAAGLMCAATAGQRGRRVVVLERNAQPGRKILISGGGRCNFTNLHCTPANFLSENPHFAKSALALYQPHHFLELVDRYGIPWHEKTLGQLFCDGSARAIVDLLLAECARGKVEMVLDARDVAVERDAPGFRVVCPRGEFQAEALVVATGGLSIPKIGATGLAYDLARQFGLAVIPLRPALVPLVLGGEEALWTELAGVATEVEAWAEGAGRTARGQSGGTVRFREKLLVTHRGLSGPAVLQASSYWRQGKPLFVDFAPGFNGTDRLLDPLRQTGAQRDDAALRQALRAVMPHRLAGFLADTGAPANWRNEALEECERRLHRWPFHPTSTEGFEKAEVTAGGVDTADLQARTMEARSVPGLFFIGEAVDVTGHLGGFNFQWAWASAGAAGRAL
ncbi:MAG TPA: aminoacetone oxidase family FAD-binding enzyme [Terracidiphilus sp.]|nr:aminoacetone oxidase family FAD-binding enzyme [Terracidiphilus sp.]